MASGPITSWQIDGETMETVTDFIFLGTKITADGDWSHGIKRHLLLGRKTMTNLDNGLKSRYIILPTKVHIVKAMVFPVVKYGCELDHKEGWALNNWCLLIVVLEKILESPLEIKPINPKGNQPWIFIGRNDAEAEAPTLWPPDAKSLLMGKDPDAGKDWGQGNKRVTESEMVGLHHWHNGHEFEQTPGDSERLGSPCSPWGPKELDTTWQMNNILEMKKW